MDEWYTPPSLFEILGLEFDIDVASPVGGTGHVPAKRFFSVEDDGLSQEWAGRVWMNPPYSKPGPWVIKWLNHGNGLALLPMAKSKWFNNLMNNPNAYFVMLPSTLKFLCKNGAPLSLMMASTLWAIGDGNVGRLRELTEYFGRVR